jgi:alpha-mannosidase
VAQTGDGSPSIGCGSTTTDLGAGKRGTPIYGPAEVEIVRKHALRAEVRVVRTIGTGSQLFQTYRLDAGARRLEIRTEVDWRESRTLLRALFPVDVRARYASFGTQFGTLERPTHRNTSWEEARFEVPGHAWMDLSEPGFGVSVLDDGKFGRSAIENVLGLSLLRSPSFPDADADRGEHVFAYALMVHDGDWRDAGVDTEAEAFREPLQAKRLKRGAKGRPNASAAPFHIEHDQHVGVQVSAWKPAERGSSTDRILRLVEGRGGRGEVRLHWQEAVERVEPVNVLERPFGRRDAVPEVRHSRKDRTTTIVMDPFRIVTLRVVG